MLVINWEKQFLYFGMLVALIPHPALLAGYILHSLKVVGFLSDMKLALVWHF